MSKVKIVWEVGDRVISGESSLGTVVQVDKDNTMFRYLVAFDNGARKWFPVWNNPDVLRKVEV